MAPLFSLSSFRKSTKINVDDSLSSSSSKVTKEHSLSRDIRVGALGSTDPQAVDNLKQSIRTQEVLSKAYSATKVVLDVTKEASSAFPPLNCVAGGILVIIKHFEQVSSNREDVHKLIKRLESLLDSLIEPCDRTELQLRISLKTKFDDMFLKLDAIRQQGKCSAFIKNVDQAGEISRMMKDIGEALTDYQTSLQQVIYKTVVESGDIIWLDRLPYAKDAAYSSGDRKGCLAGTRIELLRAIEAWVEDPTALCFFWLNGMAGTGKSTIAQTIAERTLAIGLFGASFFCTRALTNRSNITIIIPTLAYQLSCLSHQYRSQLVDIIKSDPTVGHSSLSVQFEKLLILPLRNSKIETIIIIDALDECVDNNPESAFLRLLSEQVDHLPSVKFFITGRPEERIDAGFQLPPLQPHTEIRLLHEIDPTLVDRDIKKFLMDSFSQLVKSPRGKKWKLTSDWPIDDDISTLVRKAGGLFIYAQTTFRFIDSGYENPRKLLRTIISLPESSSNQALVGLDILYTQILRDGFAGVDLTRATEIFDRFRMVIGSVVMLFNPLTTNSLDVLLDLDQHETLTSLSPLHSLLIVPCAESERPIRILHKSFSDYIQDPSRCNDNRFYIDSATHHAYLSLRCLDLMKNKLKKNICDLPRFLRNAEVMNLSVRKKQFIDNALEYASEFWAEHLKMATMGDKELITKIVASLVEFFKHDFLPWLEILSITGKLALAVYALHIIMQWLSNLDWNTQEVSDMVDDCTRFVLHFFDGIKESSQHIYRSALPWSPESSLVRSLHQQELQSEVKIMRGIDHTWHPCLRTIQIDSDIRAIAILRRDDKIAVGDRSGTCNIFDTTSGSVITVLKTSGQVTSATFSSDGSLFASGFEGGDIIVWDVQTGIRKVLFQGGTSNSVWSIAFAPKGTLLSSGTHDGKVRIWDVISEGPLKLAMEGHTRSVESVCWCSDGSKVVSGSLDESAKVWDATAGHCLHTIQVIGSVRCVAWSPDGSKIGLSTEKLIRTYDARTYDRLSSLKVESRYPRFDFSPKGDHLVYCSGSSVLIRNLSLDVDVSRFVGHTSNVRLVAFSSSGTFVISAGAVDNLVKIWPFRSGEKGFVHQAKSPKVPDAVSFSPNGRLMATATMHEGEVKLWDPITLSHIATLYLDPKQTGMFPKLVFSPDSSLIACRFRGSDSMRVWNVDTRAVLSDLHHAKFYDFCFSPGGDRIAMYYERDIQLWDARQGKLIAELTWIKDIDGNKIVFFEDGSGIQITQSSKAIIILDIMPSSHHALPFEFVASSKENPVVLVAHRDYALYKLAHGSDWILDSKNWSMCWIPHDQRIKSSWSWDAHGANIVWCSRKGLIFLDFSHISLDTDNKIDKID